MSNHDIIDIDPAPQKPRPIHIPPEVREILNAANEDGEFAAVIGMDFIKLTDRGGTNVIRHASFPDAVRFQEEVLSRVDWAAYAAANNPTT